MSLRQQTKGTIDSAGKGNRPKWHGIPTLWASKEKATRIRIIKNEVPITLGSGEQVMELFDYLEHFIATPHDPKRKGFSMICSKTQHAEGHCLSCHYSELQGSEYDYINLARVVTPIQIIDYTLGHLVPRDGVNSRTKEPLGPKFEPCQLGRRCSIGSCVKNLPTAIAGTKMMPLGPSHLANLTDFDISLGKHCKSCGTGDLYPIGFECPACKSMWIKPEDTAEWQEGDFTKYADRQHGCHKCDFKGYPEEIRECSNCDTPVPLDIYDVDMTVKKTGTGTGSAMQFTAESFAPTNISDDFFEMTEPLDFEAKLLAPSIEEQATYLRLRNIFEEEDARAQSYAGSR